MSTLVNLVNIEKRYSMGKNSYHALKQVNFSIEKGELIAIIGQSGSGKSTVMHITGLLDRPTQGKYFLNGKDTESFNNNQLAHLRNIEIGFVFQQFFLLPKLNAIDNVALPLIYRNMQNKSMKKMAEKALEKVDMQQYAKHRPNELSGGQKQRVAIARALVGQPNIILADEPTGALDSKTGENVVQLLKDLNQHDGATVVMVTHDMNIATACNRQIRIHDGKIIHP